MGFVNEKDPKEQVTEIVEKRRGEDGITFEYNVKWKAEEKDPSWIPESDIKRRRSAFHLLHAYETALLNEVKVNMIAHIRELQEETLEKLEAWIKEKWPHFNNKYSKPFMTFNAFVRLNTVGNCVVTNNNETV